ncbi:hypothetical protein D1007_47551 [Hordeum vulgare]|nr:hypothetical protein D1007_47551 [Hordeum vulgare]
MNRIIWSLILQIRASQRLVKVLFLNKSSKKTIWLGLRFHKKDHVLARICLHLRRLSLGSVTNVWGPLDRFDPRQTGHLPPPTERRRVLWRCSRAIGAITPDSGSTNVLGVPRRSAEMGIWS